MSIRIKDLPPKAGQVSNSTKFVTEDLTDTANATRMVSGGDLVPNTWGASDEDSPLSTGILLVTEVAPIVRSIKDIIISVKHAPTGSFILVDAEKETGINTDIFTTILSVLVKININQFTSETATPGPVIIDGVWEKGRRMRFRLDTNDSSSQVAGIKVTIKS